MSHNSNRKETLNGVTYTIPTGCKDMVVTINSDERGPAEIIATMGKNGSCHAPMLKTISHLATVALTVGAADIDEVYKMCAGSYCPNPVNYGRGIVKSCPDAIAWAIKKWKKDHAE